MPDSAITIPQIGAVLDTLSIVGTFLFAASGALAAARLRQTIVTFAFFALVTGVGGGTVRDLLIGAVLIAVVMAGGRGIYGQAEHWWRRADR